MNRLMKAEWHRIMHSSKLKKWLAALCVVCTGLIVSDNCSSNNCTTNMMLVSATANLTYTNTAPRICLKWKY